MFSTENLLFFEPKHNRINSIKLNSQETERIYLIFKNETPPIKEFIKLPLK